MIADGRAIYEAPDGNLRVTRLSDVVRFTVRGAATGKEHVASLRITEAVLLAKSMKERMRNAGQPYLPELSSSLSAEISIAREVTGAGRAIG